MIKWPLKLYVGLLFTLLTFFQNQKKNMTFYVFFELLQTISRTLSVDGSTALHQACCEANDEAAQLLIHYGADVNIADQYGRTPLHCASTVDSTHCLQVHGLHLS